MFNILLKIFKGLLYVVPMNTIKCTHSPTHSKSWINNAKTCLSCDKFGYRSRMMFLDKNEVIPFQKCPWNALCNIGILLKIPLFSKPNLNVAQLEVFFSSDYL